MFFLLGTEKTMTVTDQRDRILRFFLRPDFGQFSPHVGAISLLGYTANLEKREKIHPVVVERVLRNIY